MRDPGQELDSDDEDQQELPSHVEFLELTKNVTSRRNAASVFFEMLQLKTWDFIEVEQTEPYGEITISPGLRFSEAPPN
jgi:cohesin complex subunit SCC1